MLKKKYDDSDMKKNMQDQYGKEEGKKVYFATIRKQAMEGVAAIPTAVNIGSKVLPAAAATIGAVGTFLQARKAGKFTRKVMKGKVGDQQKIKPKLLDAVRKKQNEMQPKTTIPSKKPNLDSKKNKITDSGEFQKNKPVDAATRKRMNAPENQFNSYELSSNDKYNVSEEGLRDWFGKSSGTTKSGRKVRGWVQVGGKYDGKPCARQPGQKSTPKCVSSSKRRSMSKSERDSAARRKRAADPNQPQKSGAAKPTNVSTDPKKKMTKENYFNRKKSIDEMDRNMGGLGLTTKVIGGGLNLAKKAVTGIQKELTKKTTQKGIEKATTRAAKKVARRGVSSKPTLGGAISGSNVVSSTPSVTKAARDVVRKKLTSRGMKPRSSSLSSINKGRLQGGAAGAVGARMGQDMADRNKTNNEEFVNEAKDKKGKGSGTKDACYHKVKSRYSVWPSAYASGALVKCRKVGAANWGNKSKNEGFSPMQVAALEAAGMVEIKEGQKCWKGYEKKGTKMMFGKRYNNCVKKKATKEEVEYTNEGVAFLKREKEKKKSSSEYLTQRDAGKLAKKKMAKKDQEKVNFLEPEETNESKTRIVKNGHTYKVVLTWRGKTYMVQMFVPSVSRPTRQEVEKEIQKLYPDAKVLSFLPRDLEPGEPTVMMGEEKRDDYGDPIGGPKISKKQLKKNLTANTPDEQHTTTTSEAAAWTKKSGKNPSGGLNEKGRKSYERENPGSDLKRPSKKVGNKRRASFCARMKGMKKKLTSAKTANDPDSRINKSLRAWNC